MLLHICPTICLPASYVRADLIDLQLEPFGVTLSGSAELVTRKPFPNKKYAVACRRSGQKAIKGILIETPCPVPLFQAVARWAIDADLVVTHRVIYRLLDNEFDAATDNMLLWYGSSKQRGGFARRWPDWVAELPPVDAMPQMKIMTDPGKTPPRCEEIGDASGFIVERRQVFDMLTVERERILQSDSFEDRMPPLETAFALAPVPDAARTEAWIVRQVAELSDRIKHRRPSRVLYQGVR
jgi:hypothetical protein